MELGAVGEYETDRVPAPYTQGVKTAGQSPYAFGVFGKRDRHAVADGPQRNLIGLLRGRDLERLAHRLRPQRGRTAGDLRADV
jgi:hypothetical protein